MRDLARLRALTRTELRFLAVALSATPFVSVGLSLLGFRRVHAALARWPQPRAARCASEEAARAKAGSVARAVSIAAGRGPVRATCLRRSLLIWWLLRCCGIATVVRVGVNRDDGNFRAHAWVELLGRPLGDAEDIAVRFPTFDRDFGTSQSGLP